MNTTRPYRMTARAAAVAATRDRIMDAVRELYVAADFAEVPLADVAARAGTTVQTVLRHFGSKAGLEEAVIERESGHVLAERRAVAPGDVDAVTAYLAQHYFADGDLVLRMLAAEGRSPVAAAAVANGRALHRAWVADAFAAWLERLDERAARRRHEQLVAICDVYTWKLLCRDGSLDEDEYRRAVGELLIALRGGLR